MTDTQPRSGRWDFAVVVGLVTALCFLRYLPEQLAFNAYAFGDQGWPLATDALLDAGLTPTRDFGYFYGLLTLLLDRAWFAVLGRTPAAAAALVGLGCLGVGLGVGRFARAAVPGWWPRALLVCALPTAVMPLPYPSPLHAIEAALLVNALASQAGGRPGAALVLATLAVFVKPGLAYVHGLLLVLLILGGYGGAAGSWRERLRRLVPAAAVGLGIATLLAGWFGWGPLLDTLFPFRAARTYEQEGYGFFFGDGRLFWRPQNPHPLYYWLSPAGFWLIATVWLVLGATRRLPRLRDPVAAAVVTCAVLHLVFVVFLFGNQWSWLYYSAVLVCGLAAVVAAPVTGPGPSRLVCGTLAALALLGQAAPVSLALSTWTTGRRYPATAGLYANQANASLWEQVREVARRDRVMVFAQTGGAAVVFPELDAPRVWFLLRSTTTEGEIDRVRDQLRAANWLVLPYDPAERPLYPQWPEFAAELAAFREVARAPSYRVLQRAGPEVGRPPGGP